MLGQFSREKETNSGLNFPTGNRMLLVVVRQTGGFGGNSLEYVVDERVHGEHGPVGNARLRMNLLEHLVNVYGVTFLPNLSLPLSFSSGFGFDNGILVVLLGWNFPGHGAKIDLSRVTIQRSSRANCTQSWNCCLLMLEIFFCRGNTHYGT